MIAILFMIIAVAVSGGEAGYLYPRPSVPFELPIQNDLNSLPVVGDSLNQIHKVAVSYSVPIEDFQYLKQLGNTPQVARPFSNQIVSSNEDSLVIEKLVAQSGNVVSNGDIGGLGQVSIVNQDYDKAAVVQDAIKETGFIGNNRIASLNREPIFNQFAKDNPAVAQQPAPPAPVQPRVTKHIYFHVPPPDVEEQPVYRAPVPPKKIYKIIFVKVPAQESSYNAQLQQIIEAGLNRNAPVEDKTLIYVLVKKPEPVQILPSPSPTPSSHEVLFVKYNENGAGAPSALSGPPREDFLFKPTAIV